jgi:hypothetical protein
MKTPLRRTTASASCVLFALLTCIASMGLATGEMRAGSLSGAHTVLASASTINLTTEGVIDWAHWGLGSPDDFNHKAGIAPQISSFTLIGTGPVQWFDDNFTGYSWTNGTPEERANSATSGIYVIGEDNGFEFSVPADTTLRTLKVYVGAYAARMHFEATLSDGSAAAYVDESFENSSDGPNRIYTLNFAADSAGQQLTVRFWVVAFLGDFGNVTLQAAVLREAAPLVELIKPVSGAIFHPASEGIQFVASTIAPFGIPEAQIRLVLNDTDVSSNLVLTGTALSRTATHTNLEANHFYRGRIIVADDLGRATTNDFIFDTFSNDGSAIVIEVEDYNHSGGSFFDNPTAGEYEGRTGVADLDFHTAGANVSAYRPDDPVATQDSSDVAREPFLSTGRTDYHVADLQDGDWLNYTRTFPSGNYHLYLRYASLMNQTLQFDQVTSDPALPNQTLRRLGTIHAPRTGNENSFRYAPIGDAFGEPIVLSFDGRTTVRLTGLEVVSGFTGLRANFFVLAPVSGAASRLPIVESAFPAPDAVNVPPDAILSIVIVHGDTEVTPSSARLWFDGVSVAADITPTAEGILLTYAPGLLQGQSQHTVQVEFTDDAPTPNVVTKSWIYTTAGYAQIPPALGTAVGTGADPGLKWRTHQLESGATTSINAAEQQLAGALGTSVHLAEDFFSGGSWVGPQGADGYFAMNYINSELDGTPAGNFNITALPTQNVEDEYFPGINTQLRPGDNVAAECLAYLEFTQTGLFEMVVNSDDGFQVTTGNRANPTFLLLGSFDGTRAAADSVFLVGISEPGVYLFRLLWFQGTGGASVEWFTVNSDGSRALINGAQNGAIRSYQRRTVGEPDLPQPPVDVPIEVALDRGSGEVVISWNATVQALQESANLRDWSDVSGASPLRVTPAGPAKYYRLRVSP